MFKMQIGYANAFERTFKTVLNKRTFDCAKDIDWVNSILNNSNQCKTYINVKDFFSINNRCNTSCAVFGKEYISDFWGNSCV